MSRYSRQELFPGIGPAGQARLRGARVVVVGCGALGSATAEMLARAGVGALTVIDRDYVEESNLQRQSLFEESDVSSGLPKAVAAEVRLRRINSDVVVRGVVADLAGDNADELLAGTDLVMDGTDNFETRFLLNDVCLRAGVPWVYGACVGSYGLVLLVRPGLTPCLRCVVPEAPAQGSLATCDTAGVIGPIVQVVAGFQVAEALKLMSGRAEALLPGMLRTDVWTGQLEVMDLSSETPWCPACTEGRYDYATRDSEVGAVLCGRDAVQLRAPKGTRVDLRALASRLRGQGLVTANAHLVRLVSPEVDLVVFPDGRAIVKKAKDAAQARSLYARYVGA